MCGVCAFGVCSKPKTRQTIKNQIADECPRRPVQQNPKHINQIVAVLA